MILKRFITTLILVALFTTPILAQQFGVSAEIRPRYERRQGFKSLFNENDEVANFVSQRTRLNIDYESERIKMKITVQNIRIWGDVPTMAKDDKAIALHEAWAEAAFLQGKLSLRLGRQEIMYDDHRIFGNVGWAQQARSHDAFLIKYISTTKHRIDVGLALNADEETLTRRAYSNAAGYKTFQYAWYHGQFNDLGVSFLFLNTGVERSNPPPATPDPAPTIDYMQTIGPRLTYKKNKFSAAATAYLQVGRYNNRDVNALQFAVNASYKLLNNFNIGLGYEYLSGKSNNDTDNAIKSFSPLFGTNHKFNGLMDYFYVGNHNESIGLNDISLNVVYRKSKFSATVTSHLFLAAADLYNDTAEKQDRNLGVEIDIVAGYQIINSLSVNLGFSSMLATATMEILKEGGNRHAANNWTWLMVTFKPKLFSWKKSKTQ